MELDGNEVGVFVGLGCFGFGPKCLENHLINWTLIVGKIRLNGGEVL